MPAVCAACGLRKWVERCREQYAVRQLKVTAQARKPRHLRALYKLYTRGAMNTPDYLQTLK